MKTDLRASSVNMTTGSPLRLILLFALPMLIGNIFQQVYHLVDTTIPQYLTDEGETHD